MSVSWSRAPRILSAIMDDATANIADDPLYPEAAKQYILRLNSIDGDGTHKEAAKYHFDNSQATTFMCRTSSRTLLTLYSCPTST